MKKFRIFGPLLLAAAVLAGCGSRGTENKEGYKTVYYLNQDADALYLVSYEEPENETPQQQISELFGRMASIPENADYQKLLPEDVTILSCVLEGNALTIDFSNAYKKIDKTREVLVRAGIVRSMVEIEGLNSVSFTVEGEDATSADGLPLGIMTADSFVEAAGRMVNAIQHTSINLYFASADGNTLHKESRSIYYSAGKPLEWAIVERIIAGPMVSGNYATVPANLQIIGVTSANGICYVNLNATFQSSQLTVDDQIPIYSIVNSICDNCSEISAVQFAVEGDSNIVFRSSVDLSTAFSPDLSLVTE
ncbi:MAG: GerMN domain-containing protein [Lachnospiraceae bacterium]|nr:GerMN domain-containing protein [Lachnospiraceae bacterium]